MSCKVEIVKHGYYRKRLFPVEPPHKVQYPDLMMRKLTDYFKALISGWLVGLSMPNSSFEHNTTLIPKAFLKRQSYPDGRYNSIEKT